MKNYSMPGKRAQKHRQRCFAGRAPGYRHAYLKEQEMLKIYNTEVSKGNNTNEKYGKHQN